MHLDKILWFINAFIIIILLLLNDKRDCDLLEVCVEDGIVNDNAKQNEDSHDDVQAHHSWYTILSTQIMKGVNTYPGKGKHKSWKG